MMHVPKKLNPQSSFKQFFSDFFRVLHDILSLVQFYQKS